MVDPLTRCDSARRDGATSSAGLRSKNPNGINKKPVYSVGMTG